MTVVDVFLGGAPETMRLSVALMRARWWLETFSELLAVRRLPFLPPHITVNPEEEVVFEWWREERKLTMYATREDLQYVRVWGVDISDDMDHGLLDSTKKAESTWRWLLDGE